jgi:hypothetical protein
MTGKQEDETCPCCKRGNLIKEDREIAFNQWTDKGYVVCRVTVRLASACGVAPKASPILPNPLLKTLLIGEYKCCREPRCRLALGAYFPGPAPFPAIIGEVSCARAV